MICYSNLERVIKTILKEYKIILSIRNKQEKTSHNSVYNTLSHHKGPFFTHVQKIHVHGKMTNKQQIIIIYQHGISLEFSNCDFDH